MDGRTSHVKSKPESVWKPSVHPVGDLGEHFEQGQYTMAHRSARGTRAIRSQVARIPGYLVSRRSHGHEIGPRSHRTRQHLLFWAMFAFLLWRPCTNLVAAFPQAGHRKDFPRPKAASGQSRFSQHSGGSKRF